MDTKNASDQKSRRLRFIGLYAASVILLFIVFTSFWAHTPPSPPQSEPLQATNNTAEKALLAADAALHTRWQQLQQANEQYALALTDAAAATDREARYKTLLGAEAAMQQTVDSLEKGNSASGAVNHTFNNVIASFKAVLQNQRSLNSLYAAVSDEDVPATVSSPDPQALAKLQNEITDKDAQITALQNQLKATQSNDKDARIAALENQLRTAQSALRTEQNKANAVQKPVVPTSPNADLVTRNERLRSAIKTFEDRVALLTRHNRELKKENDRLLAQLNSMYRNGGSTGRD